MAKSLLEYLTWLDERQVRRPQPPPIQPVKAQPSIGPLPRIKGVVWNVYGTLLRISDGELRHEVTDEFRAQIAFEKTLEEFNMWQSMTRKPGAPWKYLAEQYHDLLEQLRMKAVVPKGEIPEVDSAKLWGQLLSRLMKKDYAWDQANYGGAEAFSEKIACFFQLSLQGVTLAPGAAAALQTVRQRRLAQGLLADAQCFTFPHLLRLFQQEANIEAPGDVLDADLVHLSYQAGVRKPSPSLFQACADSFESRGISPADVVYISNILRGDLDVAKSCGFRTALLAADQLSLKARAADLKDPGCRPDRLMTSLDQIADLLER